jgi:diguanylate cyclase (GGDEF)-like protein/PAS domain S-box-containing protein
MTKIVLLISASNELLKAILEMLPQGDENDLQIVHEALLADALARIEREPIDAVLIDMTLPESPGLPMLGRLVLAIPHLPVIALGEANTEDLFKPALASGAQDYILRSRLDRYSLTRALEGAIGRKAMEDALFLEKERAQVTLSSIGDAVLSTDSAGIVTYLNAVAERMTGWTSEEAKGRAVTEVLHVIDSQTGLRVLNPLHIAMEKNETVGLSANSLLVRRDGVEFAIEDSAAPIHDRLGHAAGAVTVFHDVSESRAMTLKMSHLAQHDYLTDLPNRLLLSDRISRAISLAKRYNRKIAVLFLDLDHLKHINDSLGHSIGDQLLQAVSRRLISAVRGSDTVSRQGGDEFVILLPEIEHAEDAAAIAEGIRSALMLPYLINGHDLHISASIGISVYPDDGVDPEALLKSADIALYEAKNQGRNNFQFFRAELNARAVERQAVEENLRRALERDEFVLNYQPKVNLSTGLITGGEALIRWHHPKRGLVFPKSFIAIAEESGLIIGIGKWVLREACTKAHQWVQSGLVFDQIAVNISATEFRSKGFLELVCTILKETGLDPSKLELELTETSLIQDVEATLEIFDTLSKMGVHLAVDDFGTGYSSLSYLHRFPIDTLKIDQSFVRDILTNDDNATIVGTVIAMGKNLKQRIVAEGIETDDQLGFLQSQDCPEGQGYYFSRPVPASQFAGLLQSGLPEDVRPSHA